MAKKQPPKYPGKLAQPLPLLPEAAHPAEQSAVAMTEARKKEIGERLWLLLQHYGISFDDREHWYKLALRLAGDHVPGFQVERRGTDLAWDYKRERQLYRDVLSLMKKGHSASRACEILARKGPYRDITAESDDARAKSLRLRFNQRKAFFAHLDELRDDPAQAKRRRNLSPPVLRMKRESVDAPPTGTEADKIVQALAGQAKDDADREIAALLANRLNL